MNNVLSYCDYIHELGRKLKTWSLFLLSMTTLMVSEKFQCWKTQWNYLVPSLEFQLLRDRAFKLNFNVVSQQYTFYKVLQIIDQASDYKLIIASCLAQNKSFIMWIMLIFISLYAYNARVCVGTCMCTCICLHLGDRAWDLVSFLIKFYHNFITKALTESGPH